MNLPERSLEKVPLLGHISQPLAQFGFSLVTTLMEYLQGIFLDTLFLCRVMEAYLLWGQLTIMGVVAALVTMAMFGFINTSIMLGLNLAPTLMEKLLVTCLDGQFHCRVMAVC